MKFKVGDKVKIIDSGKICSTYVEWVKTNIKSKKLQNLFDAGCFYLDEHKNDIFTVKAKSPREFRSTRMLYYIQNDETKKCYLIAENGIKVVLVSKQKHFKSLPNNYTGTIEVENGFIKEILDEVEKRYLKAVIKPFKNKVVNISKQLCFNGKYYIKIELNANSIRFPFFENGAMYNGMKENKEYTLKELGLDE